MLHYSDVLASWLSVLEQRDVEAFQQSRRGKWAPVKEPVVKVPCAMRGKRYGPALSAIAQLCGVAVVVEDRRHLFAVGTRDCVQGYEEVCLSLYATCRANSGPAVYTEAIGYMHSPPLRYLAAVQAQRIGLLRVQHKVCELYPALRRWRPGGWKPGQPEVLLRHCAMDGAHRLDLGGVVWNRAYYTTRTAEAKMLRKCKS